jgi:hypothetical protein
LNVKLFIPRREIHLLLAKDRKYVRWLGLDIALKSGVAIRRPGYSRGDILCGTELRIQGYAGRTGNHYCIVLCIGRKRDYARPASRAQ